MNRNNDIKATKVVKESLLEYGIANYQRTIPHILDGMKEVQRRISYYMKDITNFTKSAKIVGGVLGEYHPHGDGSVYEAMVNMARDFSMRYPLVQGQGNFGSIDGSNAAAYRYTEAKLSKISKELLKYLNVADYKDNFSNDLKEPITLMTYLPILLMNGATGIASGISTKLVPHNIKSILSCVIALLKDGSTTQSKLINIIKAPDFPAGGILLKNDEMLNIYKKGYGKLILRGDVEILENLLIIKSLPYQVSLPEIIKKIETLLKTKTIKESDIKDIRNETSSKVGFRYVIELAKNVNPENILHILYKNTSLEKPISVSQNAIGTDGKIIEHFTLIDYLTIYLQNIKNLKLRVTQRSINKINKTLFVLNTKIKACKNADGIIKELKKTNPDLITKFNFTKEESEIILNAKISTFSKQKKYENEIKELNIKLIPLNLIINDKKELNDSLIIELQTLSEKFKDKRRTKIVESFEKLEQGEESNILLLKDNYVIRYNKQSINYSGVSSKIKGKKDDLKILDMLRINSSKDIFVMTNRSRLFKLNTSKHLINSEWNKPNNKLNDISYLIQLEKGEKVIQVIEDCLTKKELLISIFDNGSVRINETSNIHTLNKKDISPRSVKNNTKLIKIMFANKNDNLLIVSKLGKYGNFKISDLPSNNQLRGSGVKVFKLKSKVDNIQGAEIIQKDKYLYINSVINNVSHLTKLKVNDLKTHIKGSSGTILIKDVKNENVSNVLFNKNYTLIKTKKYIKYSKIDEIKESKIRNRGIIISDTKAQVL